MFEPFVRFCQEAYQELKLSSWLSRQEMMASTIVVIVLTAFHSLVQGPALSRLREAALDSPGDAELAARIRRKFARAGIVSGLNLLATLATLVLAARLVTG